MAFAKIETTLVIDYGDQNNKPAGGFRLFYQPDLDKPLDETCPSVPIGYSDRPGVIVDDTDNSILRVNAKHLLPLFYIPPELSFRQVILAVAGVDAEGNQGNLSTPYNISISAPTFAAFTLTDD